ncbi:uncharacterized protein LOC130243380 [Danio aesculapii]|uniref:uncharacterized protein LOC130243380 n=1 Tax=Danio aesculapii TaxID=1142201 RepID=UPI0024BF8793|nr:uncharacterized protein LOC130243380 [Danio aesculapii]
MKMSQPFTKSFKHNLPKTSNEQHSSKAKSSCPNVTESNSLKTDVLCNSAHKVRRFKTRKERNQIRGQERSRSQPCPQQNRKEVGEKTQRHHIHPMSSSRNERPFAKPFLPQKPSIITEGRLTSIKGLFSNEVRSLDIERLVSEQIKQDNHKKEQRKQSMVHIRSQLPPLVPDSDQDCIFKDVLEPENNSPPHIKRKTSRKELTGEKTSGFQTNRQLEVSAPTASSSVDEKHRRNTRTVMEGNNSQKQQNSPKEPEQVILSSSENEPVHQFCSTPGETNKHNFNISQTSTLRTPDDGNHIQRFEETSAIVEFPNMEDRQPLTSLPGLDSGAGQLANNDKQEEEMSVSCREGVKRLAKRLCSASDLYVPSHQRSLLDKCKKTLMQTLQKRHSFQLNHNLHMLRSSLNGKQKASQLSTEQTCENRSPFSHAVEIEDRCNTSNMLIWTDSAVQQNFLSDQVPRHQDRGMSTKKRKVQEWKISSPQFFLKEPQQSQVDMFDQWRRPAMLSQNSFRSHQHPIGELFNQDQIFTQHAAPILKAPTWEDHPVNPHSQQQFRSRGESWTNVDLDLSKISQQFREDTNVNIDSYQFYDSRKQRPQEASFGGSSFWSHQLQIQDERKKTSPFSFSASYLTEGFQYEPFFRCPHPSNTQHRSEYPSIMTLCPRSQSHTPFYPHLFP